MLALLHLNAFKDHGQVRSWKTFDWDAMDRLNEKGFIEDPKSKANSVPLTAEGVTASEQAFRRRLREKLPSLMQTSSESSKMPLKPCQIIVLTSSVNPKPHI